MKKTAVARSVQENMKVVVVINNQFTNAPNTTQIASGGGTFSASGTNSAIESSNTKQQFSVDGAEASLAFNSGMDSEQIEQSSKSFNKKQQLSDDGPKLFIS